MASDLIRQCHNGKVADTCPYLQQLGDKVLSRLALPVILWNGSIVPAVSSRLTTVVL